MRMERDAERVKYGRAREAGSKLRHGEWVRRGGCDETSIAEPSRDKKWARQAEKKT